MFFNTHKNKFFDLKAYMERRRRLRATNTQEHYIYCEQGKEFFSQKQKGSLPLDGTHAKAKRVEQSTKNSFPQTHTRSRRAEGDGGKNFFFLPLLPSLFPLIIMRERKG